MPAEELRALVLAVLAAGAAAGLVLALLGRASRAGLRAGAPAAGAAAGAVAGYLVLEGLPPWPAKEALDGLGWALVAGAVLALASLPRRAPASLALALRALLLWGSLRLLLARRVEDVWSAGEGHLRLAAWTAGLLALGLLWSAGLRRAGPRLGALTLWLAAVATCLLGLSAFVARAMALGASCAGLAGGLFAATFLVRDEELAARAAPAALLPLGLLAVYLVTYGTFDWSPWAFAGAACAPAMGFVGARLPERWGRWRPAAVFALALLCAAAATAGPLRAYFVEAAEQEAYGY